MDVSQAMSQLAEIHKHLTRTEVYRGYRSQTVAVTGVVALVGATFQSAILDSLGGLNAVHYWVTIAVVNVLLVASDIVWDYYRAFSPLQRKMTATVIGQLLPCLAVGAVVTVAVALKVPHFLGLLPGLWALLYAMGIFASRPHLAHGVGWVGLFYFVAGSWLLLTAQPVFQSPWLMGSVFGLGQLFLSSALYWNQERTSHV